MRLCASPVWFVLVQAGKYYESDNQPYCEQHYFALTAEKCDFCHQTVEESNLARVAGKAYHNSCLFCHHCNAPLAKKGSIFQKDNHVYCREDYLNFFCKRCTACGDHLVNSCVTVNEEFYHPECLKCSVCQKQLDKYICMAGHLRCDEHTEFSTDKFNCAVCSKVIESTVVMSAGKKCHEACFNCSVCGDKLSKSSAWLKNDQFCCQKCLLLKDDKSKSSSSSAAGAGAGAGRRFSSLSLSRLSHFLVCRVLSWSVLSTPHPASFVLSSSLRRFSISIGRAASIQKVCPLQSAANFLAIIFTCSLSGLLLDF